MRTIASFESAIPDLSGGPGMPGYGLAAAIAHGLGDRGVLVLGVREYRGIGWSVDCAVGSARPHLYVGQLGLHAAPWQLFVCSGLTGLRRLFGTDGRAQRRLAEAVHDVLVGDARISTLAWFHSLPSEDASDRPF